MQTSATPMQIPKLPSLRVKDIKAFHPGDQVTIEHLNALCWLCTSRGTVHSIHARSYYDDHNKVCYAPTILIRKYRCRKRGWCFYPGDQVRITRGW